ncbi:methionyl-tRNA formyltransferase [Paenibacillus baekrokdamisoli]|uniref:Methionyl-tRNA formyltransferase n=1 Tax=Paenibacillus baekrokdamisoli TaxID=1712516 RepID=A0A3G9IMW9_9BACL|nr:methionyl-tRNA formyltransferase [Paenibacillus baekrokdamisoli]MBB3067162.1 methionyl-tRNA formyltransferase [Paenibacillus baekrokdamisoli]BBH19646.1 methionyl-tRNA formyltransferase [Paenibacillus baekrokdamisoli]
MRIIFMGTPAFAVASLEALLKAGHEIVLVVTQPDRPKGRKKTLTPPPVKDAAIFHGLEVAQPERLRSSDTVAQIVELRPDLIVTAAYGQILPKAVLDAPRLGCINVHGSLLPQYRGGAPIQRSIINGETLTGVTIMYMAEGLDTGDMISRVEVPIANEDTSGTLFEKLTIAGADLLMQTLPSIENETVQATPQNHSEATYAPNLTREDERIQWSQSASNIYNQVRGLSPMAGAFTIWNEEAFKVWGCTPLEGGSVSSSAQPGTVIETSDAGIVVQTGEGRLLLTLIQPAGKKAMPAVEWLKGARLPAGTVFGRGEA